MGIAFRLDHCRKHNPKHNPRWLVRSLTGLLCLWSLLAVHPGAALSQDISVQVTVNRNSVPLDGTVQLTVTIFNTQIDRLELPPLDGFQVRYLHPSTSFSWVNGRTSQSQAHTYALYPQKTGTFEIPSMNLELKGKTYTTQPITINVFDKPTPHQQYSPEQEQEPIALEDRIFLEVHTPEQEYYLYEEIPVTIKLFVGGITVGDIQFPVFEKAGFFSGEFQQPRQYEDIVDGVRFEVLEFQTKMYPQRTGVLEFGPVQLDCSIQRRRQRRRRTIFDNDFFGGAMMSEDFFDDFFGRIEKRPYRVQAEPIPINVRPLPIEGQPQDFSGAVGRFTFQVQVSPDKVNVGDPITMKAQVRGQGDLRQIQVPAYQEDEQFKVYQPELKDDPAVKTVEQVLIPKSDEIRQIPPLSFSYFDPEVQQYRTLQQGPFALTVEPALNNQTLTVVAPTATTVEQTVQEKLGRDIVFIKEKPGQIYALDYRFYKSSKIKLMYVLSSLLFLVFLVIFNRYRRMKTDIAYARRLKAPKAAKQGLLAARTFLAQDQPEKFYNQIFKTLQDYFGNKLHLPSQGLTFDKLHVIVKDRHIDVALSRKLKDLFQQCDEVRFASMSIDKNKMRQSLQDCEELIDACERTWK
jgi:hypothetical protein